MKEYTELSDTLESELWLPCGGEADWEKAWENLLGAGYMILHILCQILYVYSRQAHVTHFSESTVVV